jgi:regulator of sigma D
MSPIENLTNDNSQKRPSTAREILAKKQMKNWTCDDIKDFLNEHQFEKFTKILVEANGNDLFQLYSMSQDNNNKLLDYMKQENPEISLSNYLRFMRIVEGYATQANTNG